MLEPAGAVAAPQAMPVVKLASAKSPGIMMRMPVPAPAGIGMAQTTDVPSVGVVVALKNCSQVTAATWLTARIPNRLPAEPFTTPATMLPDAGKNGVSAFAAAAMGTCWMNSG